MGAMPPSASYSILFEKIMSSEMLMNLRNLRFVNLWRFIRSLSATMPPRLFGFFTSTNASGRPFTKSVMSGLNSSRPFLHVSSAVQ